MVEGATGWGLFADAPINKGETLIVWTGRIYSAEEALLLMPTEDRHFLLQIGPGFYQAPFDSEREPADLINHSC